MPDTKKSQEARIPWNRGRPIGQKLPLNLQQVWHIRMRLEMANNTRDLALFNLAIDSKLRGCDLVSLMVSDVANGDTVRTRTWVVQQKTGHRVRFEITERTRDSISALIEKEKLTMGSYLFPSRLHSSPHLSTRQYARIVDRWVESIGLDPLNYGTHTLRRTKPTLLYRQTQNLRACQLLLGHQKIESTVRYLGVEIDDALEMSEQVDV